MSLTISVVIPTHNRLVGLQDSLASLLRQTDLPDEIVVVDDGSKEPVPQTLFQSFPAEIEFKLLRNDKPMGGNNARNRGVLASTADYIAFLDDDDAFKSNKIEELKKVISSNQELDVIYHPAHIHMVNEGVSYYSKPKSFKKGDDIFRQLLVKNLIGGTPMVTIKRQSLIDVGLFDEEMPALQDYELWLRMAKAGAKFYYLDKPLTDYRYFSKKGSVSKNALSNNSAVNIIERKYFNYYKVLSSCELKKYNAEKEYRRVHTHLLNGDYFESIYSYLRFLRLEFSVINLAVLFALFLGPRFVFKMKSLMAI